MKQMFSLILLAVVITVWCTPSFAIPETIGPAGSPWTSDATGSANGYFINNGGTAYTLDVTAGFPNIFTANLGGPYTNPAVGTNNASLSNIIFSSTSNVYGTIGTGASFADITLTGATSVNFYGTVNTSTMHVATGTADFLSGTNNNNAAITFTGDGTVNLAPNTTVIGAITNQSANRGTLVLGSASVLNGAVGGATGLKAINVVGGNNTAGISSTIMGATNSYSISLLTNTLNIGGALTIAPNGVIDTTVASALVYGNIITTGSVTIGTGTVINENIVGDAGIIPALSIVSNYTSPITVVATIANGGTLDLSGSGSGTVGSLNGVSGSAVNLGGNTLTTGGLGTTDSYAGVISGTGGSLTKVGTGTTTLSGANTYTGATTVSAGTLKAGVITQAFGLSSAMTIASGATLDLGGFNETIGSLAGAGIVTDNGANAILTAGGDNTSTAFSGLIANGSGATALTKAGTGTLSLSGANTYSGGTIINAGTLQVSNATALGTGAVTNNAVLALGTNDLVLGNTYTQNSGSSLNLTANSSSSYGDITSTGHAAAVSGTSAVNVSVGGYIPNGAILEIINTGGTGIGSAPNTVNTIESGGFVYSPRVRFSDSIINGNLVITADHSTTGFASLANNNNAHATGNVLDNETNPSSDMTNVLNTLEFLSNAQTTTALNSLGPVIDGGILESTTSSLNNFIGASLERAQNVLTFASSENVDSTGVSSGDENPLNSLWAKQYGGYMDQGTRDGIEGYNAWNTGTAVGLDRMVNDDLTLGASLGYAYGRVNSDANSASTYINSAEGTLYAAYQGQNHPYFIDAAGSFANNWYDGQRSINVGTINRVADSEYQGQQYGVYLDGGYKFDVGHSIVLTPLTSLQWTHLTLGSYSETDAGDLDLMVNRQSYNILESGLGASISSQEKYNWGNLTPEFHAKWLYDFINDNMSVTSSFTGGGASFVSTGASPARDAVNIGGSLSFNLKNDVSLIAGVDTEMRDNFIAVYGSVSVRYKF